MVWDFSLRILFGIFGSLKAFPAPLNARLFSETKSFRFLSPLPFFPVTFSVLSPLFFSEDFALIFSEPLFEPFAEFLSKVIIPNVFCSVVRLSEIFLGALSGDPTDFVTLG